MTLTDPLLGVPVFLSDKLAFKSNTLLFWLLLGQTRFSPAAQDRLLRPPPARTAVASLRDQDAVVSRGRVQAAAPFSSDQDLDKGTGRWEDGD